MTGSAQAHPHSYLLISTAGAGTTTALDAFGSYGLPQLGNLPCSELDTMVRFRMKGTSASGWVFHVDYQRADEATFKACVDTIKQLKSDFPTLKIFTLDAPNETLIQRFQKSNKPHPLIGANANTDSLQQAIQLDKDRFSELKTLKDYSVDTSSTQPRELRLKIAKVLGFETAADSVDVNIQTFGFKYGIPLDADYVLDMRFIKNPFYIDDLRDQTGVDKPVQEYIYAQEDVQTYLDHLAGMMQIMLKKYQQEGKTQVSLAVGCTGGKHRSVCMGLALGDILKSAFPSYNVKVTHREMFRWPSQTLPSKKG